MGRRYVTSTMLCLAMLFVTGCVSWNQAEVDAHRAQLGAMVEGIEAHQAWLDCLQQMRETEGLGPLALHPCLLDAMRETDEAVSAANEAIEAVEAVNP